MPYPLAPLFCRPWTLNGIPPRLIESHYEHNYGAAVSRVNELTQEIEALDLARTPASVVRRLKHEQTEALGSAVLHELYFASLGGDGRSPPESIANVIAENFGTVDRWRDEFSALARSLAGGSGWVLLTFVPRTTALVNQDPRDRHVRARLSSRIRAKLDCVRSGFHAQHRLDGGA
jgi:Fe-Mn family superoxide dismutase